MKTGDIVGMMIYDRLVALVQVRDLCEYMVDRYEDDPDLFVKNMFPPFDKAWLEDRK